MSKARRHCQSGKVDIDQGSFQSSSPVALISRQSMEISLHTLSSLSCKQIKAKHAIPQNNMHHLRAFWRCYQLNACQARLARGLAVWSVSSGVASAKSTQVTYASSLVTEHCQHSAITLKANQNTVIFRLRCNHEIFSLYGPHAEIGLISSEAPSRTRRHHVFRRRSRILDPILPSAVICRFAKRQVIQT